MEFAKTMAKIGVYYLVGSAATTAGMFVGIVAAGAALPVVEQKSKKFFSRFMEEEKEES